MHTAALVLLRASRAQPPLRLGSSRTYLGLIPSYTFSPITCDRGPTFDDPSALVHPSFVRQHLFFPGIEHTRALPRPLPARLKTADMLYTHFRRARVPTQTMRPTLPCVCARRLSRPASQHATRASAQTQAVTMPHRHRQPILVGLAPFL